MAEESTRRVELVAESNDSKREAARTGGGLMLGLFLGRNSLMAAASGSEQFEFAIAHFVGLVLASVAGALLLGTVYDRMSREAARTDREPEADDTSTPEPASDTSSPELPMGMPT